MSKEVEEREEERDELLSRISTLYRLHREKVREGGRR